MRIQISGRPIWLDLLVEQLQLHLDSQPDYAALATTYHMSESTLRRQFKEHLGMPVHTYLLQLRINRACELLASTRLPIKEIAAVIKEENERRSESGAPRIHFHTDAVQTAGKLDINVQELGVDLLSLSAHKFYGPKGVGALYLKRGTKLLPLLQGGHHERNLRPGTENVPGIVGLAKALELSLAGHKKEQARLLKLKERFEKGIVAKIPEVVVNATGADRVAGISNISFKYVEGESLLLSLDMEGIAASTGSACASGSLETSHVLKAMCIEPTIAQGTLRFSFGHDNTEEDVDYVLEVLPRVLARLRDMSPLWRKSHHS
jgi:cysteine desulfurase